MEKHLTNMYGPARPEADRGDVDVNTRSARQSNLDEPQNALISPAISHIDPVGASEEILRRFGARAVTLLTTPHAAADGRSLPTRLSANDCYVALEEACRKMARVALRNYLRGPALDGREFGESLTKLFPDPAAYLARAIKSVIADAERAIRREAPAISLDQPIGADDGGSPLHLSDLLAEKDPSRQPEEALLEESDRRTFHAALGHALQALPTNYLLALQRDMQRQQERNDGARLDPASAKERQTVCRARSTLSTLLRRECGEDNPFLNILSRQRNSRVARKTQPTPWTGERQENLFRRLMQTGWAERAAVREDEAVDEAVVNEVSRTSASAPPSPEMRKAMRVLDLYTVSCPTPRTPAAAALYEQARSMRQAGRLEEALQLFKACHTAEPGFIEAWNNVGNLHSQLGQLREALKVFLDIIERDAPGEHRYIAATNAADIYLTWFDSGRSRERNIQNAIHYAQLAMQKPTPMRACNLLLAYVKDRYYPEARQVMDTILKEDNPRCSGEKFLQTLFQIRDTDLIAWWNWLDGVMQEEKQS